MKLLPTACLVTLFVFAGAFPARQAGAETPETQCGRGRIKLAAAPERCPCCGFSPVAVVLYGIAPTYLPGDLEAGRVVLGGCIVGERGRWKCTRCGAVFDRKETP